MILRARNSLLKKLKQAGVDNVVVNEAVQYGREDSLNDINCDKLKKDELEKLQKIARAEVNNDPTANAVARRITSYFLLTGDKSEDKPVGTCQALEMALRNYIAKAPHKWLIGEDEDGNQLAYYVSSIRYHPPDARRESPASTSLSMEFAYRGKKSERCVTWNKSDLLGQKSVKKLLLEEDLQLETPEFLEKYEWQVAEYNKTYPQTGEQFSAIGMGRSDERYGRSRSMTVEGQPSKVVIDDLLVDEEDNTLRSTSIVFSTSLFWDAVRKKVDLDDIDEDAEEDEAIGSSDNALPIHPFVNCFRLEDHSFYDIHVDNLKPYVWDTQVINKLVLSEEKKDLIEILITSAGEVMEDIVSGKTGGIIVAASGPPGTGKTLTAEVYCEQTKRPLYVVQCSQLGTNEDKVESKLKEVLDRASRWRAILLIDECDVYVRERGDDIQQNAIVGVFLRTLERYRGILFLTTNRATVIDDAIVSRLTAHLRYELPNTEELAKIWLVLSENYKVELSQPLIVKLAKEMPMSGRSVKNILKLAGVVLKKRKEKPSIELFKRLARFQDIEKSTE